jgi:pimeloyl-ACP methyl ester carboxylesterase
VGAVIVTSLTRFGLEQIALVGYSMGGNLVLKLAGEWSRQSPLVAVATVCPAIDLAAGADALHEPGEPHLRVSFSAQSQAPPPRKAELFPGVYQVDGSSAHPLDPRVRSQNRRALLRLSRRRRLLLSRRSARVIDRVAVPTLILSAQDDPFIRLLPETRARILANPHITFVESRHGGHCAFLARAPGRDALG